jgi:hypothetical protein
MTDDTPRGSPGRCLKTGTPYDETTAGRPARPRVLLGRVACSRFVGAERLAGGVADEGTEAR